MQQERLYRYELIFLSLLVLVLPSLEALKTTFWFIYVCLFLAVRFRSGELKLLPVQLPNIVISLFLLATLVSTVINWPFENGVKGFFDEVRYASLFLCLYNGGYSEKELRRIALLIVVGVIGGLGYGLVEFLIGVRPEMQFHSAGIVTQSAIYLGIAIIITTGLILDKDRHSARYLKYLVAAWFIQVIFLVYMGSRGSLLAVSLVLGLVAIMNFRMKAIISFVSVFAIILLGAGLLLTKFPDNVVSKFLAFQYSAERIQNSDAERIQIWRLPLAKLKAGDDLIWGVGPRNYESLEHSNIVRNSPELSKIQNFNHAHNLFLTQLIEQGIIGLLAMLFFFITVLLKILAIWRREDAGRHEWPWYAGLAGFTIPLLAGMFNTPYYQEHAMLSMLAIGMMFCLDRNATRPVSG
jgi:O-antigen ligase